MSFVSLTKSQSGGYDVSERYLFVRPEHVVTIECNEQGVTRLLLVTGDVRFIEETIAEAHLRLDPPSR